MNLSMRFHPHGWAPRPMRNSKPLNERYRDIASTIPGGLPACEFALRITPALDPSCSQIRVCFPSQTMTELSGNVCDHLSGQLRFGG